VLLAYFGNDREGVGIYSSVAAFLLGELVGFAEIVSRYRDEPLTASMTVYGASYFAINGLLSWAGFVAIENSPQAFPAFVGHPYWAAICAAFGAMAISRSKLFVFRSEDGKEFPVGPDIVLSSILKIVDRKIDRQRAVRRQRLVFSKASEIAGLIATAADFDIAANFLIVSMSSFQNLSEAERQQIATAADRLKKDMVGVPNLYKAMTLAFALLDITGEENFSDMVTDLEQYLKQVKQKQPLPSQSQVSTATAGAVSGAMLPGRTDLLA
jgi:hypothetical protein